MKLTALASAILVSVLSSPLHSAGEYQHVFPRIDAGQSPGILPFLATYAREQGLKPLQPNHVRLFVQPMGIISSAFDVDLESGALTRYPGTHDKPGIRKSVLDAASLKVVRETLTSEAFRNFPEQSSKAGLDGCSYLIEVDREKKYLWRLRWQPDEPVFQMLDKLFREKSGNEGLKRAQPGAAQPPAPK